MKNIIESSQIPEDTKVYLKKDWTGWRVVEPIKDENGKFLWKRILLGTTKERVFLGFIFLIALLGYLAFDEQLDNYNRVVNNPCAYCNSCQVFNREFIEELNSKQINQLSSLNISLNDLNG